MKTGTEASKRAAVTVFILFLAGYLALTLTLAFCQPYGDSRNLLDPPDESVRYLVPEYICEHGALPTGLEKEVRIPGYGYSHALFNVLPYIFQAGVMRLVKLSGGSGPALLYAARLTDVFFGLLMAVTVWLTGKELFDRLSLRCLFGFGVVWQPMNLFVHSYVNTDSCCLLAVSLIMYALIRARREGYTWRNCAVLSVGVILCALSYYNAYGTILAAIILFLAAWTERRDDRTVYRFHDMLPKGIFICVTVLLGIGWWFGRQAVVLNGDMLGLRTRTEMAIRYGNKEVSPLVSYQARGIGVLTMLRTEQFLPKLCGTFIAAYGSLVLKPHYAYYFVYALLYAVGFAGCIRLAVRRFRDGSWKRTLLFHLALLLCTAAPLIILIRYAWTCDFQAQGRYMLPALIPLILWFSKGIEAWTDKTHRWLPVCFTVLVVLLAVWQVLFVALPAYRL